jgi:hypothetical protein
MPDPVIELTIKLTNPTALVALATIQEVAESLTEDLPWRDDLPELLNAVKHLMENLAIVQSGERYNAVRLTMEG